SFALTQRMFVAALSFALALAGLQAWRSLPIDAFPDISPTQVKVILKVPGMTAEEIERTVTYPLETELLGIPRQQILRSTTKYAITDITLDFTEGTDIYWARQQVSERLAGLMGSLPEGTDGGLAPMSTPLSEIFMFSLENPNLELWERRELLDWVVRPALRTVAGVADVNVLGGHVRSMQITPDPERMRVAGVDNAQLRRAIEGNNRNAGVGRLEQGSDALIVRSEARLADIDALRRLVVKSAGGDAVTLGQLARVETSHLTRYGAVTRDGEETTEGLVVALRGSNTGDVVAAVKARLSEVERSLPAGSTLNVFYDRAQLIESAVGTMSLALLQAVVLVGILLALFLGNIRAALIVAFSLPMAALVTFLLMSLTGITANLMSLGGLVIAIGMLVDASVVVVENVLSRLAANSPLPKAHIVYRAVREVATPVLAGTIIVLIVFSPLLALQGLEGKLFSPVALTIVFAMLAALVFAFTVVPVLASAVLGTAGAVPPRFVEFLKTRYAGSLRLALDKPLIPAFIALLLLVISGLLFSQIGRTFMPVMDEGDIIVQTEKSPSISLAASIDIDRQMEIAMRERVPEIRQVVARTGSDELGLDPMSLNETDIFMQLAPTDEWRPGGKPALIAAVREVVEEFPGMSFGFTQPIQMRVSEMLTGSTGDVSIKVFGDNLQTLGVILDQITAEVGGITGAVDLQPSLAASDAFLNLKLRSELAAPAGLDADGFVAFLRSQFEGERVGTIVEGAKRIPVMLARSTDERPGSEAGLADTPLQLPDGSVATVGAMASITKAPGPVLIEREQGSRYAALSLNVQGRDIDGFVREAQRRLSEAVTLPPGYSLRFGGEFENQQRALTRLMTLVPLMLLLIVIILFATFRSLALAGMILANVPFALMGGIAALYISGEYLSVPASVGLIALLGVAVLNGVVMVSYFEQNANQLMDIGERVVSGAAQRLRPILMTASTALFGLLPLVFATGPGAELQRPLAIVVIGGLLSSTLTTLYILPIAYQQLARWRS
ncbi:efflux RND transporter permease subunit, partial [Congregibacter sp.]|uniref:efflux RND transporter permease subunit n=1 Tax=Congregibacter sp. TaxID=2744308 RepID=UPI003F6A895E